MSGIGIVLAAILALIVGVVAWAGAEAERAMHVSETEDDWDPSPGVER